MTARGDLYVRQRAWLREQCGLLYWSEYDVLMAHWGLYVDDSENGGNFAVGGCLAPIDTWQRLTIDWVGVLQDFGVCWFHATDLWTFKNEYLQWKGDLERRGDFYEKLFGLVEKHGIRPVAYVIPASEAKTSRLRRGPRQQPKGSAAIKERTKRILDDGFCKGLAWAYNRAAGLLAHEPADVMLRVVVADQAGKNGFAEILYAMAKRYASNRGRMASDITTQANPRAVVPLQVADLVAWETTFDRTQKSPRPTFLRLRRLGGAFKVGQPPRMFEEWGPPDPLLLLEAIKALLEEMGDKADA